MFVLEVPHNFERDLQKEKSINLGVTINAIDGAAAGCRQMFM